MDYNKLLSECDDKYFGIYLENQKKDLSEMQQIFNTAISAISDFTCIIEIILSEFPQFKPKYEHHIIKVKNNIELITKTILKENKKMDKNCANFLEFAFIIRDLVANPIIHDEEELDPKIAKEYVQIFLEYSKTL